MQTSKLFLFSTILFTLTSLLGCGEQSESSNSTKVEATSEQNNQTQIEEYVSPLPADAPTYKVAISAGSPPFDFKNEFGNLIGYDIDLIRAIGEESGFKVEFHEVALADLQSALVDGKYDLNLSSSLKADSNLLKSKPYMRGNLVYLVKRDSSLKTVEDFQDKMIAVQANTTLTDILQEEIPSAIPLLEQSLFLAMQAVFTDKADAVIGEEAVLIYQSEQFEDHPIRFIFSKQPQQNRIIVSGTEKKSEIISEVNKGFETIQSNGKYNQINQKWFGMYATSLEVK